MGMVIPLPRRACAPVRMVRAAQGTPLEPRFERSRYLDGPGWREMVLRLLTAGPVIARTQTSCARLQMVGTVQSGARSDGRAWLRARFGGWSGVQLSCSSELSQLALELRVLDSKGCCVHSLLPACGAGREQFYRLLDGVDSCRSTVLPTADGVVHHPRDDCATARLAAAGMQSGQPSLGRLRGPWRDVLRLGCARGCTRVPVPSLLDLLRASVDRRIHLSVCVVNRAMAQGASLLPARLQRDGSGWTLSNHAMQLQLLDHMVAEVWAVRCPENADGASFVDVLDRSGGLVMRLRGRPKPGLAEPADWRQLIDELLVVHQACRRAQFGPNMRQSGDRR